MRRGTLILLSAIAAAAATVLTVRASEPEPLDPLVKGVYISTGDNHWLGKSIAVDSPDSIAAAFDVFRNVLGAERVYWRGLQEASMLECGHVRPQNFRYHTAYLWFRQLLEEENLEQVACRIAHQAGMELWGVGTLGDWGCGPQTPGFNDYPWFWESRLRLEHPEWVPVDKYGLRKQGGTIELGYPEARKALVDLHLRLVDRNGYDGMMLLTYVENFSQRFQDEFGYSEPVVEEFEKRFGIDIRTQEFNRSASRSDWYRLRGEYVTAYLRELKEALAARGVKLGVFINPRTPRKPMVWATLPHEYWTLGNIEMDIDTWVRDGIVDELSVLGNSSGSAQTDTLDDCLWLARGSDTEITFTTSGLLRPHWQSYYDRGIGAVYAHGEDHWYLLGSRMPKQEASALEHGSLYEKMLFLSQLIDDRSTASFEQVLPLAEHENVLMRRLALHALGKTRDPRAVPVLESALFDPENGVRCKAMQALQEVNRPESVDAIIRAVATYGNHPLHEMARDVLPQIRPAQHEALVRTMLHHANAVARTTAIRALGRLGPREQDIASIGQAMKDTHRYARFAAAQALSSAPATEEGVNLLLETLENDDVALADRAAVTLGALVRSDSEAVRPHRPRILDSLTRLFSKMGDGSEREDAEWGYRPVGEAILALGEEGETVLRSLMDQETDRRLSQCAWRVLYFRQKRSDNYFNVISEHENEEAFRARPSWMPRMVIVHLRQDFESTRTMPDEASGTVGDATAQYGRWNTFGPKGPYLDREYAHGGARSVRLVRGGSSLNGWTALAMPADREYALECWMRRGLRGALILSLRNKGNVDAAKIFVSPSGQVHYGRQRDGKFTWQESGLQLPEREWTAMRLEVDQAEGTYRVAVSSDGQTWRESTIKAPVRASEGVYLLRFTPQGEAGSYVHIDDIQLAEQR